MPDLGVIRIHPQQYGTIVQKHVSEGSFVKQGDELYVISGERRSSALGETQKLIGIEVDKKLESLRQQVEKLRRLQRTERKSLERMIAAMSSEKADLEEMKKSQAARVELAEQAAARYERLRAQGFVSREQLAAKREVLLDQRSRRQQLRRESSSTTRQLADLRSQIEGLPLKYENQIAELERVIASTRQELAENEAARRFTITAPASGIATAVQGDIGQFVDGSAALVSIVPQGAKLHAKLRAPSRAVGFLDVGDSVRIRYDAFPYQKFGHHEGEVTTISRAAVPAAAGGAQTEQGGARAQPMYEVTVELGAQTVRAYGEDRPLKAGMTVQADVRQETRRLYEWVLEPLYTLTGKVQ